jgi:hypothetical protein
MRLFFVGQSLYLFEMPSKCDRCECCGDVDEYVMPVSVRIGGVGGVIKPKVKLCVECTNSVNDVNVDCKYDMTTTKTDDGLLTTTTTTTKTTTINTWKRITTRTIRTTETTTTDDATTTSSMTATDDATFTTILRGDDEDEGDDDDVDDETTYFDPFGDNN